MDRLTRWEDDAVASLTHCFDCVPGPDNYRCGMCGHFENALVRLAQYEDLGKAPAELKKLIMGWSDA